MALAVLVYLFYGFEVQQCHLTGHVLRTPTPPGPLQSASSYLDFRNKDNDMRELVDDVILNVQLSLLARWIDLVASPWCM